MIIGILVRNIKTYSGINYIPLSHGHSFCSLLGNNGIGKSSILEALDCIFNSRQWNFNVTVRKSGFTNAKPHIVPIYLINKNLVSIQHKERAELISSFVWNCTEADVLPQNKPHFKSFQDQRETLKQNYSQKEYLLLPLGVSHDNVPNLSIFNTRMLGEMLFDDFEKTNQQIQDDDLQQLQELQIELKSLYEYIYIPKDIDPEEFTQLETKEIQSLMGETLNQIVEQCVPPQKIQEINNSLNTFIDKLSSTLGEYTFRTSGERQVNLRKHDVYNLVIQAYFKIRKLNKKEGPYWLELSLLSSGEKQKAIIEIAYQFLKNYRSKTDNLIIAIDEPESSLHMSACYDQFDKLFEMSNLCNQLILTTHWYGFIPTIENGCVTVISKSDTQHKSHLVDISRYRESIKESLKFTKGEIPYDIRLKSINDFTQSIITSILSEPPYNWLICEGSSEKIYLEYYLLDIKAEYRLRVIPVGGAKEVKRIYNNLLVAYEEFKTEVKGKVILVYDTDAELVQFPTKNEYKNLVCYRLVRDDRLQRTTLVKPDSNPVSPKTEIEDCLDGKAFLKTLKEFTTEYTALSSIISNDQQENDLESHFHLDLSASKQRILEEFFDSSNNKFRFANSYINNLGPLAEPPEWIKELKRLYVS